jgi:tetratricopeptide (TPR) repeat protein
MFLCEGSAAMPETEEPAERRELAKVFSVREGDARHQALEAFVRERPNYGEGHLYLGQSYMLNRFSATLELPMSVIVLGGARSVPTYAPPDMVSEHLKKAEEHFSRAMELDPELTMPATSNIAAVKLAAKEYEAAIAYIEELMREDDRSHEPSSRGGAEMLRQHLGIAYRETGDYEKAIELFQSIVDGELTRVHRNLALTYVCMGDPAKAEAEQREQLRSEESDLDRRLAEAIQADARGDEDEARGAYLGIAEACTFDGQNELLGANARRRAARLAESGR